MFFFSSIFVLYYVHTQNKNNKTKQKYWQQNCFEINKKKEKRTKPEEKKMLMLMLWSLTILSVIYTRFLSEIHQLIYIQMWIITKKNKFGDCLKCEFKFVCILLLLFTNILHCYVALIMNNHCNEEKEKRIHYYLENYSFE